MNWHVVGVAALVLLVIATIVVFANMMANFEYGTARQTRFWALTFGILAVADIFVLGAVW